MTCIDGKVLTFEDLIHIPNRVSFLDAALVKHCRSQLLAKCKVEFLPIHIWESFLPEKSGVLVVDKYSFRMYKIMMFGILKSGEKITVVLDNVLPFVELRVPHDEDAEEFKQKAHEVCREQGFKLKETHVVTGATIKEYGDKAKFIQLCFSSLSERKKCITCFDDLGYETTHDDATCYYRMVSRDTLTPWTNWCTIEGYKTTKTHPFFNTVYTVNLDYHKVRAYQGDIFADADLRQDKTIEACFDLETRDPSETSEVPYPTSSTAEMPNISLTFNFVDAEQFPKADCTPDAASYAFSRPAGHLVQYNITTMMTLPMANRTTIMCRTMSEQIMAFGIINRRMQADYFVGFNSDHYDWWWLAEKARQFKLLEFLERNMSIPDLALYRQLEGKLFQNPKTEFSDPGLPAAKNSWGGYEFWKKYTFKISAELQNYPAACLNYPGYVCIDLMPQLRALCGNPEKYSLHKFLEMFQLGDKVEMPYKVMFRRFTRNRALLDCMKKGVGSVEPLANMLWTSIEQTAHAIDAHLESAKGTTRIMFPDDDDAERWCPTFWEAVQLSAKEMVSVAEYCIVDSERCHDLLLKTQFIRDKRQVGVLSYTTMDDCIYRANGMKVRNMIIALGQKRDLHISNRPPKKIEVGKYPGAYVFPPKKGVATAKPSLDEMRVSQDIQYQDWQNMSAVDYERCLVKISTCGIWLDEYKENLLDYPEAFRDWLAVDSHYPIAGLDFSSLYPSLIMAYNFSPEMMVHTLERAVELASLGKKIHPVNFPFNGRAIKGWSIRSQYPERQQEIDAVLKSIQKITKVEDPDGVKEQQLLDHLEAMLRDTEFGLFPTVLKDLFDQRVGLKAQLKPLTHRKEEIELMPTEEYHAHAEEFSILMGKWNYLNSKQKALKVFMNTFYGESGNAMSPLRVLALAGGVTSSGQYNIKKVAQLVQDLMCRIYAGDTDSVYISMPRSTFRVCDRAYYSQRGMWASVLIKRELKKNKSGEMVHHETREWMLVDQAAGRDMCDVGPLSKAAYFECLVTWSFVAIKYINKAVNDALQADNGTVFLAMAFEEFLFPAWFFCKKKYGGIEHAGEYNRNPKDLFVRGLEYVKKGTSEMLKDLSKAILFQVADISNIVPINILVERKIEEIYTTRNIDFEKFVKTASYKPNKKNVAVHTFHRRMEALGMAPEPLDRFRYVMVKKYPFKYDIKGKKTPLSVGDRMEYADRARQLNMEIDLDYYMQSNVCGQLARFISWHEDFDMTPRDDSDEAYTEAEKKNIAAASKYIERCYDRWSDKHTSKGPALRTLYKKVNEVFHEEFSSVMRVSDLFQVDHDKVQDNQCMFQTIQLKIEKQCRADSKREAEKIIANMTLKDVAFAIAKRNCYKALLHQRKLYVGKVAPQLHSSMREKIQHLRKLFSKRDLILEQCISSLTSIVGIDKENFDTLEPIIARINTLDTENLRQQISIEIGSTVTHKDLLVLSEIDGLYLKLLSIHKLVRVTEIVMDDLSNYVHYKLGGHQVAEMNHLDDLDEWLDGNDE